MTIRSLTRKALVALAVAGTAAAGMAASPAHAVVVDSDGIIISGGKSDFGGDPHLLGKPWTPGTVAFDVAGGTTTARVTGRTYLDDAPGFCVRTRMQYRNTANTVLATNYRPTLCSGTSGLHKTATWTRSYASPNVAKVTVSTQLQLTSGAWSTTASASAVMDTN